jgi:hypothetical protein
MKRSRPFVERHLAAMTFAKVKRGLSRAAFDPLPPRVLHLRSQSVFGRGFHSIGVLMFRILIFCLLYPQCTINVIKFTKGFNPQLDSSAG